MGKELFRSFGLVVLLALGLVGSASAGDAIFQSVGGSQKTTVRPACPAAEFPPIAFDFDPLPSLIPPGPDNRAVIICDVHTTIGGKPMPGVGIELGGDILDPDGSSLFVLEPRTGLTGLDGRKRFNFPGIRGSGAQLTGNLTGDLLVDSAEVGCKVATRFLCDENDPLEPGACLNNNRFKVDVHWRDFDGSTGFGMVGEKFDDVGASFWFFDPANIELVVDVLDNCALNDHYWVFYAAATDVEYNLTVTDTHTGSVKAYGNPLGVRSPAITDTTAFATCP